MTQDDKQLMLIDLCARLPYHLHCIGKEDEESKHFIIDGIEILAIIGGKICSKVKVYEAYKTWSYQRTLEIECIKPYLRPMSSMTKEEYKEMQMVLDGGKCAALMNNTNGLELWLESVDTDPTICFDSLVDVQDWLNAHHFDYRGLIEKGLANIAPKGMYDIK